MSLPERLGLKGKPIYLMDGTAFLFRGFYASGNMQRSDGFHTGAIFILTRLLLRILKLEQPAYFGFIMDGRGPNFRHELYPEYKAQRSATPEDLIAQIEPVQAVIRAMGLSLTVSDNCEADDCIASLAKRYRDEHPIVIIGADKDLKQCLAPNVILWDPATRDEKITTLADFEKETGLTPDQWPDFQAVTGDPSDNIPGIPGIGPKTASTIFKTHPTLENIRDNFENLPPKMQDKIKPSLQDIFTYRKLTLLATSYCKELSLHNLVPASPNLEELTALLEEYELYSLLGPAKQLAKQSAKESGKQLGQPRAQPTTKTVEGQATSEQEKEHFAAEKSKSPAKNTASPQENAQTQMSLFASLKGPEDEVKPKLIDPFAALPAPEPTECLPENLPDLCGKEVAILAQANYWHLALENKEYRIAAYKNDDAVLAIPEIQPELLTRLSQAKLLITPDVKALLLASNAWQIVPAWFDLGLAAYLLNPEDRDYAWSHLAFRQAHSAQISPKAPALLALRIKEQFAPKLQEAGLMGLMQNLELPLIPVLAQMQKRGICLDLQAFSLFLNEVQNELEHLTKEIYQQAGQEFNIRSSQQLQQILFETLKLPKAGKTKGGALSTSQEALEKLADKHPIIDTIQEYRKLEKMRSTYLEPFPQLVDANGRVHTCFNQLATATGRLSSSNPNLQNIPVRGPLGSRMRSCFIASPGKLLVSADYSQIELRVLAHLSQDPALLEAFRKGEDIHRSTASLLFEKAQADITPDERRNAKTINFGIIYGMGAQKLARELKIPMTEAKNFITRYFEKLSTLKNYYDTIVEQAQRDEFVVTMAGRRRFIPEISSANAQALSQARRQAINTVIQGSAADIIKIAMLRVNNDQTLGSLGARLILQVHDELLLEAPASTAEQAGMRLCEIMSNISVNGESLSVPLLVDWGTAQNWGDAH